MLGGAFNRTDETKTDIRTIGNTLLYGGPSRNGLCDLSYNIANTLRNRSYGSVIVNSYHYVQGKYKRSGDIQGILRFGWETQETPPQLFAQPNGIPYY